MPPCNSGTWSLVFRSSLLMSSLVFLSLAACRAPAVPRVPLEPPGLPARIEAARSLASSRSGGDTGLSFSEAVGRLRRQNPRVVDARAAALSPQALARTPAPLPNPTFALGPVLLFGVSNALS